jgi:NMD protein affecting ribosome stability and mRNA decay
MGLCGNCGKRPIAKHSDALCQICLVVNKKRSAAKRNLNKLIRKKKCTKTGNVYKK